MRLPRHIFAAVLCALSLRAFLLVKFQFHWTRPMEPNQYGEVARHVLAGEGLMFDTNYIDKIREIAIKERRMVETNEIQPPVEKNLVPWRGRMPGYSLLLAVTFFFGAQRVLPLRILQIITDSAACLIIYGIGLLLFNRRIGIYCAWLYALWLPNALASTFPGHDSLMSFFILLSLFLFLVSVQKNSWRWYALTAAAIATGVCFRQEPFFFPFLWGAGLVLLKGYQTALRYALPMAAFVMLSMAPYAYRNYLLEGEFNMLAPLVWEGILDNIYEVDQAKLWKYRDINDATLQELGVKYPLASLPRRDFCKAKVFQIIKTNPWWFMRRVILRNVVEFTIWPYSTLTHFTGEPWLTDYIRGGGTKWGYLRDYPLQFLGRLYGKISESLIFLLACLGIWLGRRDWKRLYFAWIIPLYYYAGYLPINTQPSYIIPPKSIFLIFAVFAVDQIIRKASATGKLNPAGLGGR